MKDHPNSTKIPIWLSAELWKTLIPFVVAQLDHIQGNLLKGRLHHRIVRHLDNPELIKRLQTIENHLRTQFYTPGGVDRE